MGAFFGCARASVLLLLLLCLGTATGCTVELKRADKVVHHVVSLQQRQKAIVFQMRSYVVLRVRLRFRN
jgi:hypothetical protein